VLIGAVGSLLLLGLLAVLHRPAQAKVLVPAMIIVVGGFGIGSFWLVNGNRAGRQIASHLDNPVETAPMPAPIESIRPMAPAPRSMPAALDDLRTEKFKEDGLPNAGAIGPTVELSPPAKSEEKPQSGSGKSEDRESPPAPSKPDAVPDAEPKPKAATDPGEKPAPANLRSDEDKKKIDENRQNSDKGKGTAKDALLKKSAPEPAADRPAGALPEKPAEKPAASILEAGKKPLVMQSAQGDAQRAAKGIPQPATKGAPQPAAENTAQPAAENNLQRDKRTKKSGLLWAPNLPANEKGEAELNLQLPAEEGDYFLLVDVQGPGGVGTIQKVIPVRRAPAGPAAPATPAAPAKP
jgi:hypothetical protein